MGKSDKSATKSKSSRSEENSGSESGKTTKVPIYRYNQVDFDKLEVSELNKDGAQPLAYINYRDDNLNASTKVLVQTGNINITSHGIPSLDKPESKNNYYPDDSKREFMKIPLDPEQEACNELKEFLQKADEWAGSSEMRKKLFGKRADKYQYLECVKTPQPMNNDEDSDDDADKKKKNKTRKEYPIIDFVKMKFDVVQDGKGRLVRTKLKKVEGDKKKLIKAETMTEVANELNFHSRCKYIFYFNKIWANKSPASGSKMIMYGIGFKIMAVEYTQGKGGGLKADDIDFISEEDDDDEEPKKNTKKNKSPKMDDSDADDNEEEEDNDEEILKDKKSGKKSKDKSDDKKSSKKSKAKDEEDEVEQDDEEDEASGKKHSKKSKKDKAQVEEDEEEDDEPKKSSKKGKKSKVTVDDDEEDDEEEIKPKKKDKSKKSSKKVKSE